MPIRPMLAVLAAAATVAACGGDPQTPSASREAATRKALLQFSACMRAHGVPMQDPQFGSGGRVTLSSGGPGSQQVSPETQRAADRACAHYMKQIKSPPSSPARQAEFRKQALAHSRCMRSHGVPDFPDPQFGAGGRMTLTLDKRSGIDPRSPAFARAQAACAKFGPKLGVTG